MANAMPLAHRRSGLRAALLLLGLLVASAPAGGAAPVPVSPGDTHRFAGVDARCPTFSWSGVAGARGYELVVWELPAVAIGEVTASELWTLEPVLREVLPPTTSWTPAVERCLENPGRFVWFVRTVEKPVAEPTVGDEGTHDWSQPLLFELAPADPDRRSGGAGGAGKALAAAVSDDRPPFDASGPGEGRAPARTREKRAPRCAARGSSVASAPPSARRSRSSARATDGS